MAAEQAAGASIQSRVNAPVQSTKLPGVAPDQRQSAPGRTCRRAGRLLWFGHRPHINPSPYVLPLARPAKGAQGRTGCRTGTVLAIAGGRLSLAMIDRMMRYAMCCVTPDFKVGILAGRVLALLWKKDPCATCTQSSAISPAKRSFQLLRSLSDLF